MALWEHSMAMKAHTGDKNMNREPYCTWTEHGKSGDYYKPSCTNMPFNVIKWAKKNNRNIIDLFQSCPFCGRKVKL